MEVRNKPKPGKGILIFGASGHAKVVIDVIEKTEACFVQALFDDNAELCGKKMYGYEVLGGKLALLAAVDLLRSHHTVVAIGDNAIRAKIAQWLTTSGGELSEALVHPSAQLARGVMVGRGAVVMAGVVINSDSRTGDNAIINTGAVIDHDCTIGDSVHVAPRATLCGGILIGDNTLIGAGAVILPNLKIGKNVTVGAGATVLNDIEDGLTVVGSPAKPIR